MVHIAGENMEDRHRSGTAVAGNCVAMLFYGLSFVWTKIAYRSAGPITVILARLLISAALLAVVDAIIDRSKKAAGRHEVHRKKDILAVAVLAFIQPFLSFIGESLGMVSVSPGMASAIMALLPLATPLLARMVLKEHVGLGMVSGLLLSLAGILLMIGESLASASATLGGVALLFASVLAASCAAIVVRRLPSGLSAVTIVKYQNLFGAALFLPVFLVFEGKSALGLRVVPELAWSVIALAALPSTVSYALYNHAIRVLGPARASSFSNAVPVITAAFSALLLGERFGPAKIVGMAMVIGGVVVAQMKPPARNAQGDMA
jgi:drug/metabolite transporter (DMT)-like permease